ncbi:hypothetical protein [Piscinibacterium candidicorallinum]|uniref:Lipoprotein n=1 Tax=Piscinibacterium candidicorallinum TaxID=1793872 RepID=A0ABV7H1Y8_9BURK
MSVFCRLPALLLAALSVLLTSGCATALKSETQPVDVELVNADGSRWRTPAVCTVRNSAQEIRGNGPMFDVKVERSMSALRVECRARCGTVGSTTASSRTATSSGTVFAGMTGLVIDHLSGKLYDYPRVVKVVMQPLPDAQPDTTLMAARDRAVNGSSARAAAAVTLSGPAAASASAAGGTAPAASSQATAAAAR